jgi:hypothetical protein
MPLLYLQYLTFNQVLCAAVDSQALLPYVLWDRVTKLTASWDTRGKVRALLARAALAAAAAAAWDSMGRQHLNVLLLCNDRQTAAATVQRSITRTAG